MIELRWCVLIFTADGRVDMLRFRNEQAAHVAERLIKGTSTAYAVCVFCDSESPNL